MPFAPMIRTALTAALTYAVFGTLWIVLSDRIAHHFFSDTHQSLWAQTAKGAFFVLLSSTLIFALLLRALRRQQSVETKLQSTEAQLAQFLERSGDVIYTYQLRPEPRMLYINQACEIIAGYRPQDFYQDAGLLARIVHPDDLEHLQARMQTDGDSAPFTLRWRTTNNETVFIEQRNVLHYDEQGEVVSVSGIGRDVTAAEMTRQNLEHMNQAYTVLWQINRLIVREMNAAQIYREACEIPLTSGNFSLVWVGVVDRAANRLTVECSTGSQQTYIENLKITLDDSPTGRGPSGLAARTGKAYWSSDIATDPIMAPWRERALAHGFRSSAAFPLKIGGEVVAVWTLYSPQPRYFSDQVHQLYDQLAGDISFALEVAANEKQRKKLISELTISDERWQFALDATGDGLWDWNLETDEIYFSSTLPAMLGYSTEEWGTTLSAWESRVHPEDLPHANAEIHRHFIGETTMYRCEMRMLCKDGQYRWILDRGRVVQRTADGKPRRIIGLHKDLTEEKEMRAYMLEREERLSAVIAESPVGIAVGESRTGHIITANPKFCEILGRSEDEVKELTWQEFTHPEDIEPNRKLMDEMLAGKTTGFTLQKRYFRADGSLIWGRLTVKRLSRYRGAGNVHLAIVEDITANVEREDRLRTLFDQAPLGIAIIDSDTAHLLSTNPKYCEIVGQTEEQLVGKTWMEITHPEDIAADAALMAELNSGKRKGFHLRKRLLKPDQSVIWVQMTIATLDHYHEARRVHTCMIEDITDLVRNEERMRLDSAVISHTRDGVVITDLRPSIISVNRAYLDITGFSEAEVIGMNPSILRSGKQDKTFYEHMWSELLATGRWQGELYNRRKNGEIYPQISTIDTIYGADGKPQYYVGVFSDITKLKKSEASFERLAHYDILTGLPNRLMVTSRLSHAIETAHRQDKHIAVLFLDLDHFKNVNDSLGHVSGDELLALVADRLLNRLRAEDTIARLGGDEFLILLEDLDSPDSAAVVARDILAALAEPFTLATGHEVYTGASIGISLFPQDGDTSSDLIRNADAAMYLSKSEGRSTFRFYKNELTIAAKRRLEIESALRKAILNNELSVKYQPIVDFATGAVTGAEALCRWKKADGSEVPPSDFIPVAEETGLIVQLGDFVLKTAFAQAKIWHGRAPQFTTMAVNVSMRQFESPEWFENFQAVLNSSSGAQGLLEIEVTESALMQRGNEAVGVISRLRETGMRVAIDDFGTGYSSLAYLQRFDVTQLKIDQSFVRELPANRATGQLVHTMITMARNLGLTALAEGVETEEQREFLQKEGCDFYQGYLKSKPVTADEFAERFF